MENEAKDRGGESVRSLSPTQETPPIVSTNGRELVEKLTKVFQRERASSCFCQGCEQRKDKHGEVECGTCGYIGRLAAVECACYDYFCPGGDGGRGAGCFHGCLTCPICDDGEADAWEYVKGVLNIMREAQALDRPEREAEITRVD